MAARINEIRQRVLDAKVALGDMIDLHMDATRREKRADFTDAEREAQRVLEHRWRTLEQDLVKAEQERDRELAGLTRVGNRAKVAGKVYGRDGLLDDGRGASIAGGVGRTYADLFGGPATLESQGWGSKSEFFAALGAGLHHPSLISAASMGESVGADGGFLVPEETVAQAFDGALEDEPVLRMVQLEPMTSETKRVAGFATKNHQTTGPFGFSGGWIGEGQPMTAEKGLVRSIKLVAKKLALLVQASSEIAADGLGFDSQLEMAMRSALAWLLSDAVFNGTGAGQPAGILAAASTVVQTKEGGQAAATIFYANVVKMISRLLPACMNRAVWFAGHTTRPQLMQLSIPIGVAGSFVPLVLGPDGIYRLLGIPLYWTEHLPALGTQGDLALLDPSQYILGIRRGVTLDRSAHVGFTSDIQTYRGILRADGQSKFDGAFQPKNGSTQGPCVVLEAR